MEQKSLKSGYTTGTCAAAAAKAAAFLLLGGSLLPCVTVRLPGGTEAVFVPERGDGKYADCIRIQKDAGDDPDVTHGSWVYASVSVTGESEWEQLLKEGRGYLEDGYPGIYITGGTGIGTVTKAGLSCPPGKYAINPVPRKMVAEAVWAVCADCACRERLCVRIAIPEGVALAGKTFNPRLGIEGGISVLGSSGIVKPMSEQALLETIRLDIRMKCREQADFVLITPGNYGEQFLWERLHVPVGEAVKCSNFFADAMEMMVEEGGGRVLVAGHIGKLVKVAGGVRNTHSKYGDRRMEILSQLAAPWGPEVCSRILAANTTEEAVGILEKQQKAGELLCLAAEAVKRQIEMWTGGRLEAEVVTFSLNPGIYGCTDNAEAMIGGRYRQEEGT